MANSPTNEVASDFSASHNHPIDTNSEPDTQSTSTKTCSASTGILQALSEATVIESLKQALNGYKARADYSLGGSIPIVPHFQSSKQEASFESSDISCPPVTLRFDIKPPTKATPPGVTSSMRVIFPPPKGLNDINLRALVYTCEPSTFGLGGKHVSNEINCKAKERNRENFSVDFHPADYGIISAIAQTLLPSVAKAMIFSKQRDGIKGEKKSDTGLTKKLDSSQKLLEEAAQRMERVKKDALSEHWGVVAQLQKLNVYSGPSGKFHKHVDAPGGATHFGSLVVCLPCNHQGGQLQVTHRDHTTTYDWSQFNSNTSKPTIQWAAFHSDCTYEVLPVTSGHCITLTYNLHISEHVGGILQKTSPTADPASYPLYEHAHSMLSQPNFMVDGGTLAFYCTHRYAHTAGPTKYKMPYALKGVDAVLYTVFEKLGMTMKVRPILKQGSYGDEYLSGDEGEVENPHSKRSKRKHERLEKNEERVGTAFHGLQLSDLNTHDRSLTEVIANVWPFEKYRNVHWLNRESGYKQLAAGYLEKANGNQLTTGYEYSYAAIFIEIPPRDTRLRMMAGKESKNGTQQEEVDTLMAKETEEEVEQDPADNQMAKESEDGEEQEEADTQMVKESAEADIQMTEASEE